MYGSCAGQLLPAGNRPPTLTGQTLSFILVVNLALPVFARRACKSILPWLFNSAMVLGSTVGRPLVIRLENCAETV